MALAAWAWWFLGGCILAVDGATVIPQPVDRVVIDVSNADVQVVGTFGPVVVDANVSGWSNGDVRSVVDDDVLFIDYTCGTSEWCGGDLLVTLPPGTSTQVSLRNGDLTLADLDGSTVANLRDGRVTALGHGSGPLVVAATGGVDLQFDVGPDRVDVETEEGDVRFVMPTGDYALDLEGARVTIDDGIVDDPASLRRIRARTPGSIRLTAR